MKTLLATIPATSVADDADLKAALAPIAFSATFVTVLKA